MGETYCLPSPLAELLGDVVFRPGRVLQESRRPGAKRIRKVSLPDAPDWQDKFGVYLPITPSGEPLKVGLGRNSRFTEPRLVDESA